MINAITPINSVQISQVNYAQPVISRADSVVIENPNIDKKPLIARRIIKQDENINDFFDKISKQVFPNSNTAPHFSELLKGGYVALSSSCYEDLKTPYSAKAVKLNPDKLSFQNCALLEDYIKEGIGVGINFNNFKNPI